MPGDPLPKGRDAEGLRVADAAEVEGGLGRLPGGAGRRRLRRLDHSMIYFGNGMSDSDNHVHLDLPMTVFGGHFKGNSHVRFEGTPMANLWMTAAAAMDVPLESFGISTGRLEI